MGKVDGQMQILTEDQFNKTPLKNQMSYSEYFEKRLKEYSTFTFARQFALKEAQDTSQNIKDGVDGWYVSKEKQKDDAEELYYAALAQYEAMKNAQNNAFKDLKYATNIYGEESTQYLDALKKYNLSSKSLFGADVNLGIARDKFNFANFSAYKAYLSTQITT